MSGVDKTMDIRETFLNWINSLQVTAVLNRAVLHDYYILKNGAKQSVPYRTSSKKMASKFQAMLSVTFQDV